MVTARNTATLAMLLYSGNREDTTFVNNTGADKSIHLYGGAVSNQGTIGNAVADFVGNYINGEALSSKAQFMVRRCRQ